MASIDMTDTLTAEQVASKIADACKDLCKNHWPRIDHIITTSEDGKASISLGVTVSHNGNGHDVRTKFSVGIKYKDERDDYVDDPNQATITFEEKEDA